MIFNHNPLNVVNIKIDRNRQLLLSDTVGIINHLPHGLVKAFRSTLEEACEADRIVVMSMGYVQQIGTPIELYDKPNNVFVANFIGLPPMNMQEVEVLENEIKTDDYRIPLTTEFFNEEELDVIRKYIGKKLILGIRPEDIHENGDIDFTVTLNENLGQNTLVHGMLNGKHVTCKFKRWANYLPNDKIKVGFAKGKIHFFDVETTNRIY